jgi:hypothetical protein
MVEYNMHMIYLSKYENLMEKLIDLFWQLRHEKGSYFLPN